MNDTTYSGHTAEEVIELMGMLAAQHDVHSDDETLAIARRGYALLKDLQSRLDEVLAERDALKVALEVIAKQALAADMPAIGVDPTEADYEAGYIGCVETARNALAVAEPEVNSKSRLKRVAMQRAAREVDSGSRETKAKPQWG